MIVSNTTNAYKRIIFITNISDFILLSYFSEELCTKFCLRVRKPSNSCCSNIKLFSSTIATSHTFKLIGKIIIIF